jgi:transcription elongation factor Elf1
MMLVTMLPSLYCCDCPECHSEIVVSLEKSHRSFGDNEKMLYRVVCDSCGLAYDVHFEDLHLREKSDTQGAIHPHSTTVPRE